MKTKTKPIVICRKHWTAYIVPGVFFGFLFVGGVITLFSGDSDGLLAMAWSAALFGISFLLIHSNYLALHEDSVVGKVGFIKTVKMVSPISKVQDVSVRSGLFGKIFGYSTITVSTAGTAGTEYIFPRVAKAGEFQQKYIDFSNKQ